MTGMSLDMLPLELLFDLLQHLHSIEDLLSLFSTCRTLFRACSNPNPKIVLRLAADSGRIFFRPHPHLLLAATARQLADWVVEEEHHRYLLEAAIHGGVEKLFELAIDVAGLSMDDIRRLYTYKCYVINPLNRDVDITAGPASYYGMTVSNDPETALLSWAIYGELFHHSLELAYLPFPRYKPLSSIIRFKWFVYCMPDINSFNYMKFSRDEKPQFFTKEDDSGSQEYVDRTQHLSMNEATHGFLSAPSWKEELEESPSFQATSQSLHELYVYCAMHAGLKSLELLVPGGVEKLEPELEVIAAGIRTSVHEDGENELQAGESLADSKAKRLLKLIGDPWLFNAYPTLTNDMNFTLWGTLAG
ncbi:hypothetical protein MSAN_01676000 [Mycena sanguinolenta]|uniref:F-box domain-containing protein n=1 Tax=Mycena sanguinolenta TaxID=230812 RepID=A0A8H6XZD6_9AGAR|nr:hypothetical protein MSAN_01676000 [Mycena sanguinolenta]